MAVLLFMPRREVFDSRFFICSEPRQSTFILTSTSTCVIVLRYSIKPVSYLLHLLFIIPIMWTQRRYRVSLGKRGWTGVSIGSTRFFHLIDGSWRNPTSVRGLGQWPYFISVQLSTLIFLIDPCFGWATIVNRLSCVYYFGNFAEFFLSICQDISKRRGILLCLAFTSRGSRSAISRVSLGCRQNLGCILFSALNILIAPLPWMWDPLTMSLLRFPHSREIITAI